MHAYILTFTVYMYIHVCVVLQFIAIPEDRSPPSLPVAPEGGFPPSLPAVPNGSSQPPQHEEIDRTVSIQSSVSVRFKKLSSTSHIVYRI